MKIKDFREWVLLESENSRFNQISEEEFNAILEKNCSNYDHTSKNRILRSSNTKGNFLLGNEFSRDKTSANKLPINLFFKHLETWKGLPDRDKSLIGMSVFPKEEIPEFRNLDYGRNIFEVFPFNGTKIAQCPKIDFWISPVYIENNFDLSISDVSFNLEALMLVAKTDGKIPEFFDYMDTFFEKNNTEGMFQQYTYLRRNKLFDFLTDFKNSNLPFKEYLGKILSPKNLDVNFISTSDENWNRYMPRLRAEVWFDGPCIMRKIAVN